MYACDGMETEQSVQKLIKQMASFRHTYRIKHPIPGYNNIVSTIAMINSQLVTMIQDSNHSLKTLQNNLHMGAKVLTLDGHIAMYLYNRMATFKKGCPLYHHDVEKTDQQDDNATIHTHSGSHIVYLAKHHLHKLGQIVYLLSMESSLMHIRIGRYLTPNTSRWSLERNSFTKCGRNS